MTYLHPMHIPILFITRQIVWLSSQHKHLGVVKVKSTRFLKHSSHCEYNVFQWGLSLTGQMLFHRIIVHINEIKFTLIYFMRAEGVLNNGNNLFLQKIANKLGETILVSE